MFLRHTHRFISNQYVQRFRARILKFEFWNFAAKEIELKEVPKCEVSFWMIWKNTIIWWAYKSSCSLLIFLLQNVILITNGINIYVHLFQAWSFCFTTLCKLWRLNFFFNKILCLALGPRCIVAVIVTTYFRLWNFYYFYYYYALFYISGSRKTILSTSSSRLSCRALRVVIIHYRYFITVFTNLLHFLSVLLSCMYQKTNQVNYSVLSFFLRF